MSILLVLVTVIVVGILIIYNSLVAKRNLMMSAFSTIDVMLKKRYDLIPNLVAAVKAYMGHEADTLAKIAGLRAQAMTAKSTDETITANHQLNKALYGMMVAVENYPDLKANQNFIQLQAALNEIEEQLSASRRTYNAAVTDLNNAVQMFPSNILARIFGFTTARLFETEAVERQNVSVADLFNRG